MPTKRQGFSALVSDVQACTICAAHLPLGPRPVFQMGRGAKILIAGQAPGRRVHETGVPFNDPSGDRLRAWLGVGREEFYDPARFAILPMGFCYPGTGKSGDLPPRSECAQTWRAALLAELGTLELVLPIGQYAINGHLKGPRKKTLRDTVRAWAEFWPEILPMPHPSPRNTLWLRKNPWFEDDVVPVLQKRVRTLLSGAS